MAKDMTWKDAIEEVLKQAGGSLHYKEIAEQVVSLGLRKNVGATPANTAYRELNTSVKDLGDKSPFVKVGKGEFVLREHYRASEKTGDILPDGKADEKQYEIITSFGMFWQRDSVPGTRTLLCWECSSLVLSRLTLASN